MNDIVSTGLPSLLRHLESYVTPANFGVLICGSATRKSLVQPGDIDIVVVTSEPWIQKRKERWQNTLLDVQIGPVTYYAERMVREVPAGLLRMFATGAAFSDDHGYVSRLQKIAKRVFGAGPAEIPLQTYYDRQRAVTLLDRARRYLNYQPVVSRALTFEALGLVCRVASSAAGRWPAAIAMEYSTLLEDATTRSLLEDLSDCDDSSAIRSIERLLEVVTGECLEASRCGSTPRIRIGGPREIGN